MKLISLWEPWATLMAIGAKKIETRSWRTSYRGWLAIHASKGGLSKSELREVLFDVTFSEALNGISLTPGHIVAIVRLDGCFPTGDLIPPSGRYCSLMETFEESVFGDFGDGRYGWVTSSLFRLPEPIPYKASQGLCDVRPEALEEIRRQWKESR